MLISWEKEKEESTMTPKFPAGAAVWLVVPVDLG